MIYVAVENLEVEKIGVDKRNSWLKVKTGYAYTIFFTSVWFELLKSDLL